MLGMLFMLAIAGVPDTRVVLLETRTSAASVFAAMLSLPLPPTSPADKCRCSNPRS